MKSDLENIYRSVLATARESVLAWSAYCLAEFAVSSLLFRIVRPYATFTPAHWRLTALLTAGYLAVGTVVGALTGAGLYVVRRKTRLIRNPDAEAVVASAATLTVVLAFTAQVLSGPADITGHYALLALSVALSIMLLAAMRSSTWSERLGFLVHPCVVVTLLLGAGQEASLVLVQDLARQLGAKTWLFSVLVGASWIGLAATAVWLGRWKARVLRAVSGPVTITVVGLTLILLSGSLWLGRESRGPTRKSPVLSSDSARPNLLVVVMDTVRADHLSVYGYERDTSPNLRSLARDSAVYTHAIAPADITLSSHASLFTGMYPSWHGAYCAPPDASYGSEMAPQVPTLAGILSGHGYVTAGVSANLYLRADFGLQRGFQTFRIPRPVPVLGGDGGWYLIRVGLRKALRFFTDTSQFDRVFSLGQNITEEFFDVISSQNLAHAPFFVFLNYMDAHFPYLPPAPFDRLFPGKDARLTQDDFDDVFGNVVQGKPMPASVSRHVLSQYDGGIAYIDAQLGQLLDWLRQRNLYDNTLIVIASDHGEAFGEKGLVLHGNSTYQNLVQVELLVKFPHGAHAGVVNDPVSLVDVAPTILSALGYAPPQAMQGRNLLESTPVPSRPIFSESFPCPVLHSTACPSGCLTRAIFSWPFKFINSSDGRSELYDLSEDAHETRDLSATNGSEGRMLRAELARWVKTAPVRSGQQLKIDPEVLQRLKSLGYVR